MRVCWLRRFTEKTAISVRRNSRRVWRGKCPSEPGHLARLIRERAPEAERVVFETGPMSVWFFHALSKERLPAICIDARHASAALDMAPNKTEANDADGLAHLAEVGFNREVRVKSFDSMVMRTLAAARTRMVVPRRKGARFEEEAVCFPSGKTSPAS